jgi:DNA polymerase elongation subunit (family B)
MTRETPYWDEIIERYKISGLTQVEFCKRNDVLLNHFLYRWHEKKKALKRRAEKAVSPREKNKRVSSFESVVLTKPSPCSLISWLCD